MRTSADCDTPKEGLRLPAREIEQLVVNAIVRKLGDPISLGRALDLKLKTSAQVSTLVAGANAMAAKLDGKRGLPVQLLLAQLVRRVDVLDVSVELLLGADAMLKELWIARPEMDEARRETTPDLMISLPVRVRRSGAVIRMVLETGVLAVSGSVDAKLLAAIAKARTWWKQLQANTDMTVTALAKAEGLAPSYVDRTLRLAFLAPSIVGEMLEGSAPADVTLHRLRDLRCIAPSWVEQRQMLGFAATRN